MYRSNLPCLLQHPQHPNPPQPLCPGGEPDAITACQRPESTSGGGGDHAKGLRQWKKGAETPRATCSSSGLCKPVQPIDTDTCANVRCEAAFRSNTQAAAPQILDTWTVRYRMGTVGQGTNDQTFVQRCISARHQIVVEWRTLCHSRAFFTGLEVLSTEAEMCREIEKWKTLVFLSTARCCGCKTTTQPASSIRCGSRAAHLHQEPSLPRFRSGGTCRQTTSQENRPAGSQHARCEPSLVSQLEAVADSGNSWWAAMSPCYIYWCSAHWPECSDSVLRMRATRPEICAEQPILRCLDEKCGPADDVGKKLVATRPVSPVAPPSSTLKDLLRLLLLDRTSPSGQMFRQAPQ